MKILKTIFLLSMLINGIFIFGQSTQDRAVFNRSNEANKTLNKPIRVVFMGNSITEHWASMHPEFFTKNNYLGKGISGQVTSQMMARFRADVINLKPKAVVILGGINDIALNNGYISVDNIFRNIVSMADSAKFNGIKVVLCSVLPAHHFPWRPEVEPINLIIELNIKIKKYAELNDIPFADYYTAMVDDRQGLSLKYQIDEVHPNMDGYKIMEPIIQNEIDKVIPPNAQIHIKNATELQAMQYDAAASYILDNDIDLLGITWVPFDFAGILDGNSYSIKNLTHSNNDQSGMFFNIEGSIVKNIGLVNVSLHGGWAGALAVYASNSTVEKCFVTGEVVSNNGLAGGLFGVMTGTSVSQCYTNMTVTGNDHVGGIAGHMEGGSIENCYTNSTIISTGWQAGGLVGWAQNAGTKITKSFAKGTVKSNGGFTGGILGIAAGAVKVVSITECLALQSSLTTTTTGFEQTFRIVANQEAATYAKNYGLTTTILNEPVRTKWNNDVFGKDGGGIISDQVVSNKFYADSLTWDFVNVWKLNPDGPALKWEKATTSSVGENKIANFNVYTDNGFIQVASVEKANISIYNISGVLLAQRTVNKTLEQFDIKGVLVVKVVTDIGIGIYKIVNN